MVATEDASRARQVARTSHHTKRHVIPKRRNLVRWSYPWTKMHLHRALGGVHTLARINFLVAYVLKRQSWQSGPTTDHARVRDRPADVWIRRLAETMLGSAATLSAIILYMASSAGMTIVNKLAVRALPLPLLVTVVQMLFTVLCLVAVPALPHCARRCTLARRATRGAGGAPSRRCSR